MLSNPRHKHAHWQKGQHGKWKTYYKILVTTTITAKDPKYWLNNSMGETKEHIGDSLSPLLFCIA